MATTNPVVTSIQNYVNENSEALYVKAVLGGKSAGMFALAPDVKGATAIHLMDTDVVLQDGKACGWTESGSTTFSNRVITPAILKVNQGFCDKNLLGTYAAYKVRLAAGSEQLPFEEKWVKSIIDAVNAKIERMIYQGDKDSESAVECDGFIKILNAESTTVKVNSVKGTSAYEFVKAVAKAIPATVKNPAILISTPMYREFMQDIVAANLYHFAPAEGENEYKLPGTDIRVIGVDGLNGTQKAIAANLENLVYGCDAEGSEAQFDLWYSKDNREFRLVIELAVGVQVAFPQEVVLGTRAE